MITDFIKGLLLSLVTFLIPIQGLLLSVGLFIAFDTCMAFWKTRKKKTTWTSRIFRNGFLRKLIPYQAAVILFYVMDFYILNEFTTKFIDIQYLLTKCLSLVLCYIELKSIDESWTSVKGKGLIQSFREMIKLTKVLKSDITELKD